MEGTGRLALPEKPLPQFVEDCAFENVLPQAVIEPGVVAPTNVVGFVLKVTILTAMLAKVAVMLPGPVKVTVVVVLAPEHANPPVQLQL